ncbi:hypothetical protein PO78_4343 [Thauera sp. SWB20]|nr:hypothetical protein PO78_4343 [Thauera sp. SWB20]
MQRRARFCFQVCSSTSVKAARAQGALAANSVRVAVAAPKSCSKRRRGRRAAKPFKARGSQVQKVGGAGCAFADGRTAVRVFRMTASERKLKRPLLAGCRYWK